MNMMKTGIAHFWYRHRGSCGSVYVCLEVRQQQQRFKFQTFLFVNFTHYFYFSFYPLYYYYY